MIYDCGKHSPNFAWVGCDYMDFVFRWADKQDIPVIKTFIVDTFGPDSVQAASGRFEALFVEHPYGFHVALSCASSQLVAIRCYLPFFLNLCGKKITAAFPVDLMVAPDYRRQGISNQFVKMSRERFAVTVSTGQSMQQIAVYTQTEAFVAAHFSRAYMCKTWPTSGGGVKAFIRDTLSWLKYKCCNRPAYHFEILNPDDLERFSFVIAERFGRNQVGCCSDINLMRWRYFNRYYNDCQLGYIEISGKKGLIAFRQTRQQTEIIDIVSYADDLDDILSAAAFVLPGVRLTAVFAGETLGNLFSKNGFLVRSYNANLTVNTYDQDIATELRDSQWLIFPGDSDISMRMQVNRP